jgi:hypothetical protein
LVSLSMGLNLCCLESLALLQVWFGFARGREKV